MWVEDQTEFESILDKGDVVVDFTAPAWCSPCQQFAPHYEKAADKSDIIFIAVDVDKAPWAMADYGVQGVPTVALFRNSQRIADLKSRVAIKLLSEIDTFLI